jgi:hypothetical protein
MSGFPKNQVYERALSNGNKVHLPEWNGLQPTAHREESSGARYNPNTGERPKFYDATIEWMRNDWPVTGHGQRLLPAENVSLDRDSIRLFYFPLTKTWHASDALDIDHQTPWREHLTDLRVRKIADAAMAYNDVSNLRMVPSFYNRARTSADAVVETYGANSEEWKQWVRERMAFDAKAELPTYDPIGDLARRTKTTIGQVWTDEHTRSDLGFDKAVLGRWFDGALRDAYVGDAEVRNPETGQTDRVPMFRCAASKQLTTRDALDIDHDIPFEIISEKMRDLFPNHVITKADMLDLYNDTSNLRLVTRGVNSSHEYERADEGQWRDKMAPKKSGEFLDFMEKGPPLEDRLQRLIHAHYNGKEETLPKLASDAPTIMLIPRSFGALDNLTPTLEAQAQAQSFPVALTHPESPYSGTYQRISAAIDSVTERDPNFYQQMKHFLNGQNPAPGHIENISTTLMAAAKEAHMSRIDGIVPSQDRQSLFAIQSDGHSDVVNRVEVPLQAALQLTVKENSERVARVDAQTLEHTMPARMEDAAPQVGRKRYREDDGEKEAPPLEQGGPLKRGSFSDSPLLDSPDHADHAKFLKVMSAIDELNPCPALLYTQAARENMASYLVLLAAQYELWEISHVVPNDKDPIDGLFAVAGGLGWETNRWAFSTLEEGVRHSVEDNTRLLARIERPPPLQDPSIPELDPHLKRQI